MRQDSPASTRDSSAESLLRRAHGKGQGAYGQLPLPVDCYVSRVLELTELRLERRGIGKTSELLNEALNKAALSDLFLAIACDEDVAGAWVILTERFVPRVQALALKRGATRQEANELASDLPGELLLSPGRVARTRLGSYDGSGSLFGWLSAIALRLLAKRQGRSHCMPLIEEESGGEESQSGDPSSLVLNAETERRFGRALRSAWNGFNPSERIALLHKYRDGLKQGDIARRLGVGDPRVSRILEKAVSQIRRAVHREFPEERWRDLDHFWQALRDAVQEDLATSRASAHYPSVEASHGQQGLA